MKTYELVFDSVNSESYSKPITMLVVEPDAFDADTGAMLFTHGWGGNRFQHRERMEYAVKNFNIAALSVEFRMSGYDFNPVTGSGSYVPYDASFMQVLDVLNGLRFYLERTPAVDRSRLFHYGGSQGGHIALLSALFAPATFAFVYASCPITDFDEIRQAWAGREFSDYEIAVRSPLRYADKYDVPLFIEHGTADTTVPVSHTERFEKALRAAGKNPKVIYYEGGEHSLEPAITKTEAFKAMAPEPLSTLANTKRDDFATGSLVEIECADRTLRLDWSRPTNSMELFSCSSKL